MDLPMLHSLEHGEASDRTPVLIAHGLFGSARNWGVIAKRLASDRQVIAVDMRNHGASPWSDDHSYPALADDLAEVIAASGGPMDVVGHSMGGKAAMTLALNHPDRLRRLVVADIAPVAYGHSQMQFVEAMRAVDLQHVSRRSEAEAQLAALGVDAGLQSFFTQSLDIPGRRWRLNLDALADQMGQILGFPEIDTAWPGPTLFLSGGASDYVLPTHRDRIRHLFPQARFAKLPGAGHWLHAEQPRPFEAAVRTFLDAPLQRGAGQD
jgi:pimeloyl-ACP methyl ester carboxylesterase